MPKCNILIYRYLYAYLPYINDTRTIYQRLKNVSRPNHQRSKYAMLCTNYKLTKNIYNFYNL